MQIEGKNSKVRWVLTSFNETISWKYFLQEFTLWNGTRTAQCARVDWTGMVYQPGSNSFPSKELNWRFFQNISPELSGDGKGALSLLLSKNATHCTYLACPSPETQVFSLLTPKGKWRAKKGPSVAYAPSPREMSTKRGPAPFRSIPSMRPNYWKNKNEWRGAPPFIFTLYKCAEKQWKILLLSQPAKHLRKVICNVLRL